MMRILSFGKNGQVGKAIAPLLLSIGEIISMGHEDLDVADSNKLRDMLHMHRPDIVVNASAYTNVDRAEFKKSLMSIF